MALSRKMTCNLRHLMSLRHPITSIKLTCANFMQAAGIEDVEPDTPKGLVRWRAKYCKSFFGNKYITDMEKASKALVAGMGWL